MTISFLHENIDKINTLNFGGFGSKLEPNVTSHKKYSVEFSLNCHTSTLECAL